MQALTLIECYTDFKSNMILIYQIEMKYKFKEGKGVFCTYKIPHV